MNSAVPLNFRPYGQSPFGLHQIKFQQKYGRLGISESYFAGHRGAEGCGTFQGSHQICLLCLLAGFGHAKPVH
jgi:hypothetical protein